jgi:hypothetical protein
LIRRIIILAATACFALLGMLAAYAIGIYPLLAVVGGDWRALLSLRWFALAALALLALTTAFAAAGWIMALRRGPAHHNRDTP